MIAPLVTPTSRSPRKVRRSRSRRKGSPSAVAVFLRIPNTEVVDRVPKWKVQLLVAWILLVIAVAVARAVFVGLG